MIFLRDSEDEARFRLEVRDWLAVNVPDHLRFVTIRPNPKELQPWHRALYQRGWSAPHWPKAYGGAEASIQEQAILIEEMARVGAPELNRLGLNFLAPALMSFGTEAQQERHLPGILSGDVIWAQGYSEPNAGSDLASLRTRADRDGDDFVVTGQKIWTSFAHYSDWMFALVRTDVSAKPKQAGISLLLIDLSSPGLTIQPIETIAGDDELATVFLDSVRVPASNLVGPLNEGWRVANHVLSFERVSSATPYRCLAALDNAKRMARASGAISDPAFRDRLAEVELDVLSHAALFNTAVESQTGDQALGFDSSIIMIVGTETQQRLCDLIVEAAGAAGGDADPIETPDGTVDAATMVLFNRHATIFGGSSEIQRNIIAKRVLGLPSS